jgi:glutathionylspermidine synthase
MLLEKMQPRPNWREQFESLGFYFHSIDGVYWDETRVYHFTLEEIEIIEDATVALHNMCMEAVDVIVRNKRYTELAIPPAFWPLIEKSWTEGQPSLYGRFDLTWNGQGDPKMHEYNADTPTSLIESGVAQWYWLQDVHPQHDQFNSVHEKLVARWGQMFADMEIPPPIVHVACDTSNEEDVGNASYIVETALQARLRCELIDIKDIGWDETQQRFVDVENRHIQALFKLYPWEWLVREEFGQNILVADTRWIEPPWKMLLANKGILPILWELFPNHPNLLPAYFQPDVFLASGEKYVKKPLFSREGENVAIMQGNTVLEAEAGRYGEEGFVYQAFAPNALVDGSYLSIGSWVVGDDAAGMALREDATVITKNTSRFMPHYFTV